MAYPDVTLPILPDPLRTYFAEEDAKRFFIGRHSYVHPSTLDVSAWTRYSETDCLQLAQQVISFVNAMRTKTHARQRLEDVPAPKMPTGLPPSHVGLPVRVAKTLNAMGAMHRFAGGNMSLQELCALPSFGAKALLRYLGLVENARSLPSAAAQIPSLIVPPICRKLGDVAKTRGLNHAKLAGRLEAYALGRAIAIECAEFFISHCADPRIAELFMRARGLGGYPVEALRVVAAQTGVSHETVRNLAALGEQGVSESAEPNLTALSRLRAFIASAQFRPRRELSSIHPEMCLAYGSDFVASLYRTAEYLGLAESFKLRQWAGRWVVLGRDDGDDVQGAVAAIARKVIYAEGVGRFSRVMDRVQAEVKTPWAPDLVGLALEMMPGFRWIQGVPGTYKRASDQPARRSLSADLRSEQAVRDCVLGEWFWSTLVPHTQTMRRALSAGHDGPESRYAEYVQFRSLNPTPKKSLPPGVTPRRASDLDVMPPFVFEQAVALSLAALTTRAPVAKATNDESAAATQSQATRPHHPHQSNHKARAASTSDSEKRPQKTGDADAKKGGNRGANKPHADATLTEDRLAA